MYRTADPQSVAEELKQIAQFKDLVENPTAPWKRYAVAVWPTVDKQTRADDRPYRNQWKDLVAPGCRKVD
jgi:hypothetical protein